MTQVNRNQTSEAVADSGITEGKLVQFTQDLAPYCKGDVVRLDSEAEKYVAARVKALGIEGSVYTSKVEPPKNHVEGSAPVVVGAVQAQNDNLPDEPTTVHGGTVVNEQDAGGSKNRPSDKEVKDRTENPKNPRGGTESDADHPGTTKAGQV